MGLPGVTTAQELVARNPYYRIYIYGPPGVGKTTLVAGASNPIFLSIGNMETESLLNFPELASVPVKVISASAELDTTIAAIRRLPKEEAYDTVIIDSWTAYAERTVQDIMAAVKKATGREDPSQAEWTKLNRKLSYTMSTLLRLPTNLIIVGHDRTEKDKDGDVIKRGPDMGDRLKNYMSGNMSCVFYYRLKGNDRVLVTAGGSSLDLKNRYGTLPKELVNPTWAVIETAHAKFRTQHSTDNDSTGEK